MPASSPGLHAALLAAAVDQPASTFVELPSQLTSERLITRPAVVPAALDGLQALGMRLYAPGLTVQRVAEVLGYDWKVLRLP